MRIFPIRSFAAAGVLAAFGLNAACGPPDLGPVPENTSHLWGSEGERWDPAGRLPDFSYAGYRAGNEPIPRVPVRANVRDFGAVGDGVTDDSLAFLDAIAQTERGAILIPAGRYLITRPLFIKKSHIVLRGESRDSTVLFFPKTLTEALGHGKDGRPSSWSWGGGWIWANPELERGDSNAPVWDEGKRLAEVTRRAPRGQTWIRVSDTAGLEPGQMVRLIQHESDGSLTMAMHAGHPLGGKCIIDVPGFQIINWLLEIKRVEGNKVHFDRPLRLDVKPEWKAELHEAVIEVEEVGIERMTIEFALTPYAGHHNEPGHNAISLGQTYNSWVRDVAILNADNGIFFWYARYATAENIVIAGRGGHYGFNLGGAQDSLVTRFRIENRNLHDTSFSNMANGNVYSWGKGRNINFDHHRGASFQNLSSRIDVGIPNRQWVSSGTRSGHYTAAHETYWNIRPRAETRRLDTWPAQNIIGRVKESKRSTSDWFDLYFEHVDELEPTDLHLAQWHRRTGLEMPKRPRWPKRLPEGRVVNTGVGPGRFPEDLVQR
ncbi:MAG: glycosyl hydrolase family 28-related protein [Thermoanaerobaculia bacterium]